MELILALMAGLVIGALLGVVTDHVLLAIRSASHHRARKRGEITPTDLVPVGLWKVFSIIGAIIGIAIVSR